MFIINFRKKNVKYSYEDLRGACDLPYLRGRKVDNQRSSWAAFMKSVIGVLIFLYRCLEDSGLCVVILSVDVKKLCGLKLEIGTRPFCVECHRNFNIIFPFQRIKI